MSESLREKSNKRILVLANNDIGLYRFRKYLLAALVRSGHEVYISLPDGGFVSELRQLGCRMAHIPYAVNITGLGSAIENGGLRSCRRNTGPRWAAAAGREWSKGSVKPSL